MLKPSCKNDPSDECYPGYGRPNGPYGEPENYRRPVPTPL